MERAGGAGTRALGLTQKNLGQISSDTLIRKLPNRILRQLGYSLVETGSPRQRTLQLQKLLGFPLNPTTNDHLLRGEAFLRALKEQGADFSLDADGVLLQIQGLEFEARTWEELFILHEIFVEGVYDVEFDHDFAAIDVGMNVGIASLYLANDSRCEVVFSYEPFPDTVDLARRNLQRNACSGKIQVFTAGLGYPPRKVAVMYSKEFKGSVGILGRTRTETPSDDKSVVELQIEDVAAAFANNLAQYSGTVVAKIDCEGAEYEIVERLHETGLLRQICVYMIEWHVEGPARLKARFLENGFYVVGRPAQNREKGMIYALRHDQ